MSDIPTMLGMHLCWWPIGRSLNSYCTFGASAFINTN